MSIKTTKSATSKSKTRKPSSRTSAAKKAAPVEAEVAPAEAPVEAEVAPAPAQETAMVASLPGLPGLATTDGDQDYGEDHAANAAALKADELIVAKLMIVQESSKIWKDRASDSTVVLGDIYNSASHQVYKANEGVLLVPIECTECVIKRSPAPEGKFLEKLAVDDPDVLTAFNANDGDGWKQLKDKQKNGLNYTNEVVCAVVDPKDGESLVGLVVVPFAGTNVYPRKLWWNRMAEQPGKTPYYAFRTVLTTRIRDPKAAIISYIYVAEAYGGNWQRCRFQVGHPNLEACKEMLKAYREGQFGDTSYVEADSGAPSEAAQEKAAF